MDGSKQIVRRYQSRGSVCSSGRFRCWVGRLSKRERRKKQERKTGGGGFSRGLGNIKYEIHPSCEIKDMIETHLCKLVCDTPIARITHIRYDIRACYVIYLSRTCLFTLRRRGRFFFFFYDKHAQQVSHPAFTHTPQDEELAHGTGPTPLSTITALKHHPAAVEAAPRPGKGGECAHTASRPCPAAHRAPVS